MSHAICDMTPPRIKLPFMVQGLWDVGVIPGTLVSFCRAMPEPYVRKTSLGAPTYTYYTDSADALC
eukprot:5608397-Prymnesium_polylepis.1